MVTILFSMVVEKCFFNAMFIHYLDPSIGVVDRVSTKPRETRVQSEVESYQKLKQRYLIPPSLNTQHYKVRIKGKCINVGKGIVPYPTRGCPHGVMFKVMDCRIVLQSRYYVHFRANTLGKGMNPLILPDMG